MPLGRAAWASRCYIIGGSVSIDLSNTARLRPQIAAMLSRAFLASEDFAGMAGERYSPERIAAQLARGEQLIALEGESILGAATLFPPDGASACPLFRSLPQLGLLGVDPRFHGRGIAGALIEAVEAEARAKGYSGLALSVTQRAPRLHALYRKRGYANAGSFHWPGAPDPSLIMEKRLG
jgi:GNAT superfamily N-acetyltransferase